MMGTAHNAPVMSIPDQPIRLLNWFHRVRADTLTQPRGAVATQRHSSSYAKHTLLGIGAPHLCDATTRGLMCASHLHWAPCENMKSSHHLNRASWEAQWRDHNCFVSKETQLTERIASQSPAGQLAHDVRISPLTLKERARVKGAHCRLLSSPIRTHWSLAHNPVGPPFNLQRRNPITR